MEVEAPKLLKLCDKTCKGEEEEEEDRKANMIERGL